MTCPKPIVRAETFETFRNKKGGISYKAEFLSRIDYDKTKFNNLVKSGVYRKVDLIPCGQCIECRLQSTREWATRCMLEKSYGYPTGQYNEDGSPIYGAPYPENTCWFLTLTYSDEYLPSSMTVNQETGEVYKGMTVRPSDMQEFWHNIRGRKKWQKMTIKYLNVSEYGSHTHRPHNHAIVFGLPLDITRFKKQGINEWGDPYWSTDELDDVWIDQDTGATRGFITIGRVTWKSAAYVARYNLKKTLNQQDQSYYDLQGIAPEHISMSNAIGLDYLKSNWDKICETDTVPVINPKSGELAKAPKRFMRIIEDVDKDIYRMIKDRRKIIAESTEYGKSLLTDLTPEERRKQSEERMKSVIHDLRKDV